MTAVIRPVVVRPATSRDGSTSLLRAFALVQCWVPAGLAVSGAGGSITPGLLLALLCAAAWAAGRAVPGAGLDVHRQPVRIAACAYAVAVAVSFAAAASLPLSGAEVSAADRGLIIAASLVGVAILAADGIPTRANLDSLLRWVVGLASGIALVGIMQFVFAYDLTAVIHLPLLAPTETAYEAITTRSGFNRVAGTTLHPIEFSVVLTMAIPIAIHLAHHTGQRRWWLAVALLATGIPMSVSRTGTIGVIAIVLVLVPTWSQVRRRRAMVAAVGFLFVMKLAFPGLIGSIRSLFTNLGSDPSIDSRRHDYSYIGDFISDRPWFGRGSMTFLPDHFDFVDNQFLLSLVEIGVVGTLALVGVFVVGMGAARGARHRSSDPVTRDLGQSLAASLCAVPLTFLTFDFMSFPVARGMAFLLVGCAGALWRFERHSEHPLRARPAVRA